MKAIVTLTFSCFLLAIPAIGQVATAEPAPGAVFYDGSQNSGSDILVRTDGRRASGKMVTDTVLLVLDRRSAQRGIIMNVNGSITGASQFYGAPQPITLTGFEFYAYKRFNTVSTPAPIVCEVYEASGTVPTGQPLISQTIDIPYSGTNLLSAIRRRVEFPNPITVNDDYVLTISLADTQSIIIACNNWATGDGDQDYYGGGFFATGWLPGSSINVGGVPFDADFFLQPFVRYRIEAGINTSTNCLEGDDTVTFSNASSPVFSSKFYNKLAFLDTSLQSTYRWTFGDGSPAYHGDDPDPHVYPTPQKYKITLRDSLLQWSFGDRYRLKAADSLDQEPVADFIFGGYRNITFTNQSTGIDKVKWIFTDSTYSDLVNPVYHYFGQGNYDVTLIIENGCGVDSVTKTVTIAPIGIDDPDHLDLGVYPNPANDVIQISGDDLAILQSLELVDITGRVVLQHTVNHSSSKQSLSVGNLSRGWYLLTGKTAAGHFSRPIVLH